jgi:transcription antitermination factor NusG
MLLLTTITGRQSNAARGAGALSAAIKRATRVVPTILTQMAASVVTTTRFTKGRDEAARPTNTPWLPIIDGSWYIREITDARVQFVWGQNSNAAYEAQVPLGTDVEDNDVVRVTSGDFAGLVAEVEQRRLDPLGNRIVLALAPTGKPPHTPGP